MTGLREYKENSLGKQMVEQTTEERGDGQTKKNW